MANSTEIKLIAQAHAQNIRQQQNEKYMQMANNMIAEQQKNDNYLQMANDIIAQESQPTPQPQQVTQPVVQPVQQKTVNEIKQIPSIADKQNKIVQPDLSTWFRPTTASGRDINKEAAVSIQKAAKDRKEASAPVGSSVNQVDLSKYNLPNEKGFTEDDIKAFEDYDKAVAWTQPDYRLTKEEQKEAKRIARQGIERLEKPTENTTGAPVYVGRSIKDMTPEEQKEYQMYKDLELRSNGLASFAVGAADKVVKQGESLVNTQLQLADAYTKLMGKLGIASPEEVETVSGIFGDAKQGVKDFDKNYIEGGREVAQGSAPIASPTIPILNEKVDITPYNTGGMATQMGEYMLTNPLFDSLGEAAGAGKVGKFLFNQAGQNLQDLALDTSFLVQQALDDGSISEEEAKDIKSNMAWNAVFNAGFGALGEIPGLVKKIANNRAAKKSAQAIADTVDNAVKEIPAIDDVTDIYKGLDNYSVDTVKNIDNAVENVAKKPQIELPKETQEQLLSDFEEYYRALDTMDEAAQKSGNAKAVEKFENLKKAVFDYEEAVWKSEDPTAINTAKKKADSTRQAFIREMKKADPNYKGELTGNKLGRAEFRRTSIPTSDEALEAITELENLGNDVVKQTDNIAESVGKSADNFSIESVNGKNGQPVYYIALKNGDMTIPVEPGKTYKSVDEAKNALDLNLQFFADKADDIAEPMLKERGLSKHIVGEDTPMKMEGVSDEVVADFKDDPDMYKVLTNAETKAKAERIYKESSNAEVQFRKLLAQKDPAALPLGHQLAKDYSAAGDHEAAAQIYRDMGNELTKAGQFSQAAAINMMKNDPLTALQYAERQIDNLNRQGAEKFGDKWKKFSLTDEEKSLFDNIKPGDEEAIKAAYDQIGARLGKEYPTTFMDKLLEGRKIAMLFNVRTNVRNVLANVPTLGMRWMADRVEALGQNAAHLINPDVKVTQSLTGSGVQGRKLAKEVFDSDKVQAMLKGDVGKYEIPELKNSLVQNKTMYKGTHFEKWLDKITDDGIQKLNIKLFGKPGVQSGLETIRNATYKMLDLGDSPFVKENFIERLGSYINAQGIKNIEDVPDEAIEMAWEEAMKATYKDNSWAVQMLSGFKRGMEKADKAVPGLGRTLSQATIPFLQAPGNIAARMVDYSPIKATKGIADILSGASKNDAKMISKGIEEAAKGLTGTGLVLLGMALRKTGILTGTFSKDKDQKAFEKQNGFQEYALHVGDKYFSYDWAQPFAEPLIVGTLLADAIEKSDEYDSDVLKYIDAKTGSNLNDSFASKVLGVTKEGTKASINSWFNASPLQGLQELMSGGYNGTDIAQNLFDTGIGDFAGAFVPASVNAVAKSTDNTQRNTYDPSNKVNTFVNQQIAKIPGLSKTLPAKYDTWGNELKNADTKAMAWASRFVIPGNYSYDRVDKVDNEINRLYEATQEAGVFPQVAPNSVGDKKLNNEDISKYQQDVGTRSRQFVEDFMASDSYESMDDANKVDTIAKLYGVSKAITERDLFGKELTNTYKGAVEAYDNAGGGEKGTKAVVDYLNAKSASDQAGLSASSNAAKAIKEDVQNGDMEAAQEKIDAAQQLPALGLDKPDPVYTYYSAQKQIPGLTVEEFANTYKAIDTDKNQGIKQDEVIDYLNKQKITSQSEADKIWAAYGNSEWKSIPSLNNGVWTKKKK